MPLPPTLKTRIAAFIRKIEGVDRGQTLASYWRGEMNAHKGRTPATLKLYVTKYRNAIREAYGPDALALTYCKHDPDNMNEVRAAYQLKVATEHKTLIPMPNWRQIVATANGALKSEDPFVLFPALLLLTGRRTVELGCSADFTGIPLEPGSKALQKWYLDFSGQAKTRGAEGSKAGETYTIPVLGPAADILKAYGRLRASDQGQQWSTLDSQTFSTRMAHRVNNACKMLFAHHWSDGAPFSAKSLRSLYAEIAYKNFAMPNQSKSSYFASVLGHAEADLQTSLSYFDYYLSEEDAEVAQAIVDSAQATLLLAIAPKTVLGTEAGPGAVPGAADVASLTATADTL